MNDKLLAYFYLSLSCILIMGTQMGLFDGINHHMESFCHSIYGASFLDYFAISLSLYDKYVSGAAFLLIAGILLYEKKYYLMVNFLVFCSILPIITLGLKAYIAYPRPVNYIQQYAFPSGHTLGMCGTLGYIDALFNDQKKTRYGCIGLMAFSRIYIKAHWLLDVIAGFAIAQTCVFFLRNRIKDIDRTALMAYASWVWYFPIGLWFVHISLNFKSQLVYYAIKAGM